MPVKTYQTDNADAPFHRRSCRARTSPSRRRRSRWLTGKQRTGGRSSTGACQSRFLGGGHKQAYREIDFKRDKHGIPAKVAAIEYDPNRTRAHRAAALRRRREALHHLRRSAWKWAAR